ncbi:TonB-dependent receptor plug domain-containing protein [Capnocytophaga felis]|uniref:Collagen-binding protein n=1 Tax=Capnocytophaga felis TaxID=2267611 RepID=A0A5M4B7K4_9FLAO|nr:TonB-dependent receptor plug domain-containing protein [Capnocytophaga felis]GET45573.1 collagen-binding protein [Capnocytophaga felis]GET47264.1 collagen-binding protein [Capnocytophaga felis]
MRKYLFFLAFLIFYQARGQVTLTFKVQDSLQNPVAQAHILVNKKGNFTNSEGICSFSLQGGKCTIKISHISFEEYSANISIKNDTLMVVSLKERREFLQEVVVTAIEKKAPTSTSVIDQKAMRHLQPSSFADLVSLLPGKSVSAPVLNQANKLTLRETGISSGNYSISSLGVAFTVDDIPINSNSNMQETVGYEMIVTPSSGYVDAKRNVTRSGIDMRSISTDDIERVEVVRGIAPANQGDLSSGLVQISRKKGKTDWNSRIKSDGFSKLFYVGKGFHFKKQNLSLNLSLDYLDAKADPRNSFENYKRYTASVRAEKQFNITNPITWSINFDYTGTIDKEKRDPDAGFDRYDSYQSTYNNVRVSNLFSMYLKDYFFKKLTFKTSVSQSYEQIKQDRWIQITSAKAIPVRWEQGEHYGIFLTPSYVSKLLVDGKPFSVFTDFSAMSKSSFWKMKNELLLGVSYSYSKNNGLGQVYDPFYPPSPDMATIPRAFKSIPAMQDFAFYVQEQIERKVGGTNFTLRAGVRGVSLLGLRGGYQMNQKVFLDPRINLMIDFPKITFKNKKHLEVNLTAGWGKQSKLPTQNMLYPQDIYRLFTQLNYYHNNKNYRQVHFKTYVFPQINGNLKVASNIKKEIRLGLSYDFHSLYVTYFNENMNSGFRKMRKFHQVNYKIYDTSTIDHTSITAPPSVENLSYQTEKALVLSSLETNGSAIDKQGIEFQYTGKRFEFINTRFTLNGAWLRTRYYNSLPMLRFADKDILNGVKHYNVGVYNEEDNYDRERFQTSLVTDTYLPKLGLTTSLRVDFNWYALNKVMPINGIPTHYIDVEGKTHPYTETQMKDYVLQWLMRPISLESQVKTPLSVNVHLKISKEFYRHFTASMYVNNLFNFYKDYYVNNEKINRRGLISPYFGMEMNINF